MELKGVSKSMGGKAVLTKLNAAIPKNRIIGLVSDNGRGKSTLLRLMAGIWQPDDGEVLRYTDSISYLIPRDAYYDWMRVRDAVQFYCVHYLAFDNEKARALIREAGFDGKTLLRRLSDGQRERLSLILAVCTRAELYLMDEPLSGMDAAFKKEVRRFLVEHLPEGATIVLATHLLKDLEQLFDQVIFLSDGGSVQKDTEELREEYGMSVEEYYLEVIRHI